MTCDTLLQDSAAEDLIVGAVSAALHKLQSPSDSNTHIKSNLMI